MGGFLRDRFQAYFHLENSDRDPLVSDNGHDPLFSDDDYLLPCSDDTDGHNSLFSVPENDVDGVDTAQSLLTPDIHGQHISPGTNVDHDVDVDMEPASPVGFIGNLESTLRTRKTERLEAITLKAMTPAERALYEDIATAGDIANLMASIHLAKGIQDHDLKEDDERDSEADDEDYPEAEDERNPEEEDEHNTGESQVEHSAREVLHTNGNFLIFGEISCSVESHASLEPCAVLSALKFKYHTELECLVDTDSGSVVIDRGTVSTAIRNQSKNRRIDKDLIPSERNVEQSPIFTHLRTIYSLEDVARATFWKSKQTIILARPWPGASAQEEACCPLCHMWMPETKKNSHNSRLHKNETNRGVWKIAYAVPAFAQHLQSRGLKFEISSSWLPPSPSSSALPSSDAASSAPVPEHIRIMQCFPFLAVMHENGADLNLAIDAVRSSNRHATINRDGMLEVVLYNFHKSLVRYIGDANTRLRNAHPDVRALITHEAKGFFRQLSARTISAYASTLTRIFGVIFRSLHANSTLCAKLQWRGSQHNQCTTFMALVEKKAETTPMAEILSFIHAFLVDMFMFRCSSEKLVDSIVEQALVYLMIDPHDGWKSPIVLDGHLVALQHFCRAVLVHVSFLGDINAPYIGVESAAEPDSNHDFSDSESDLDDLDQEEEEDLSKSDSLPPPAIDLSAIFDESLPSLEENDTESALQESQAIKDFLTKHSAIFKSRGDGQWSRLAGWWSVVIPLAQGRRQTSISWKEHGRSLEFSSSYFGPERISLDSYRLSAIKLDARIRDQTKKLLSLRGHASLALDALSVSRFCDDGSPTLFQQSGNKTLLQPMLKSLLDAAQNISEEEARDIMNQGQNLLQSIVLGCYMLCGVPPRSHQMSLMQSEPFGGFPRNVYIKDGICYLGRPRAKQFGMRTYEAFFALTENVGRSLLIFCGLFRPVEIKLAQLVAKAKGRHDLDLEPMSTFIFTSPNPRSSLTKNILWSGGMINNALRAAASPLKAEARVWRQAIIAILQRHIPVALKAIEADGDDLKAQLDIGAQMQTVFLKERVISFSDTAGFVSQAGVHCAITTARRLVPEVLGTTGSLSEIQAHASQYTSRVLNPPHIGSYLEEPDFIETCRALLLFNGQPSAVTCPPLNGYNPNIAALAMTIILLCIFEWRTGEHDDGLWATSPKRLFQEPSLIEVERVYKNQHKHWIKVSEQIFDSPRLTFDDMMENLEVDLEAVGHKRE
ncbi:hypothetical protein BDZ89DRAFT_1216440 [Hymenopellis radicata]|nr:hypothetical protein BDZ89DRAFT_1216440 [Hymenopellis radicata]